MYSQKFYNLNYFEDKELSELEEQAYNFLENLEIPECIRISEDVDDIQNIMKFATLGYERYAIFATGGSSLIGQVIKEISGTDRVLFFDNIDPYSFNIDRITDRKTFFIFISKSGNTIEILAQFHLLKSINPKDILIITEDKVSELKKISDKLKTHFIPHPTNIGGRFSAFSVTGILPCAICKFDPLKFRLGGQNYKSKLHEISLGASVLALSIKSGINVMPLITYSDQLIQLTQWYIQLISESLGKQKKGITPFTARGTVYQHSQLQLFLDGPSDKFFNIFSVKSHSSEPLNYKQESSPRFTTNSLQETFNFFKNAAMNVLQSRQLPLREIEIEELLPGNIGAIIAHLILETITTAKLLNINPFDQPAVENIKVLLSKILISDQ